MLRPAIRHVSAALIGIVLGLVLLAGFTAWRLSQGHIAAGAFRPVAERWLKAAAPGGRARVGAVEIAWFAPSGSLGFELRDVDLADREGRPVLRARRLEAGLATASLLGLSPAPGRLVAQDFFAAVSVSPEGRYELGYAASGRPGPSTGNLWRFFEDLTGHPKAGRPLSYLQQLELSNGDVSLAEIAGPVRWRGHVGAVRFDKTGGRLTASGDARIGQAVLKVKAEGLTGLKRALVEVSASGMDPAQVFPHVGATGPISILDAPVDGRAWLSWAADRGVSGADVQLAAGQGTVRLGGQPTAFHSGLVKASFDPRSSHVLIQSFAAASAQADFDVKGEAWITPPSRRTGPERLELALSAAGARLSLDPRTPPAEVRSLALRASYTPKLGRLDLSRLDLQLDGSPFLIRAIAQQPKGLGPWGLTLDATIPGLLAPRTIVALWPREQSPDARDWIRDHVGAGRIGRAVFRIRLPKGGLPAGRAIRDDQVRLTFGFEGADILAYEGLPVIHAARGSGGLYGDAYDMKVQSASIEGVGLTEGLVQIPRLAGERKRIYVDGKAEGDARRILEVVDKSSAGVARRNGLDPARLSGQADVVFSLSRYLEEGAGDFQAAYQGAVKNAKLTDATLGLTLKSAAMTLEGTAQRIAVRGPVQLGPYRGPLQYVAQFPDGRPAVQKADLAGLVDASTLGFSGPAGATLPFSARFEQDGPTGKGQIRSKAFDGETQWGGSPGRFMAQGRLHAATLKSIGLPIGKFLTDQTPVKLVLTQSAGGAWSGSLDADAYSGLITVSSGASPHFHYSAQLTPEKAQRIGLGAEVSPGRLLPVSVDVVTNGEAGAAAYGLGDWVGQVSWTQAAGARTQYRWKTTLTPADMHELGLPSGFEPKAPLPVDLTMVEAPGGGFSGSAEIAGGSFRFTATAATRGRRRMTVSGSVDGKTISDLGLGPEGMISGPAALSANLELANEGPHEGRLQMDLQRASFSAPFVSWKKPSGRPMLLGVDFSRSGGGVEATAVKGSGPGFAINATGSWKAGSGGVLHADDLKLEGAFEGSIDIALSDAGSRLATRARYFDARRLLQQPGRGAPGPGGRAAAAKPFQVDAQLAEVRVSDTALLHNVKIEAQVSPADQRRLDVSLGRQDGAELVALKLYPDAAGMAVQGQVYDVGEAAFVMFGHRSFQGGKATVTGHMTDGGADLKVEMSKVRLMKTPALARILTVGSLHGMADTLNGAGIEFTKVVAPVSIRGARLTIGRARATGPAMGITTQGVIDIDNHTVDLTGGIAPSYVLNSAIGAVPLVGDLLVSHKGEGMFGLTYSAKGAFASPKISVNPLSLAAPGILRRIFEGHSQVGGVEPAG